VSDDFDFEPRRGLPDDLPDGEVLLWQGSPDWRSLVQHALHARLAVLYIAVIALWGFAASLNDGATVPEAIAAATRVLIPGGIGLGLLAFLAWLMARNTTYSITNKRIAMRIGVALPMTVNIPLRFVTSADVKIFRDGTGDIPLAVDGPVRLGFVPLWPHVRAWRLKNPQPMLRSVPSAPAVAAKLAKALAAIHGTEPVAMSPVSSGISPRPVFGHGASAGAAA
jgi:hypothetical protein